MAVKKSISRKGKNLSRKGKGISRKRKSISRKRKGISRKNKRQKKRSYKKMRGGTNSTSEPIIVTINTDRTKIIDEYLKGNPEEVPEGLLVGLTDEEKKNLKESLENLTNSKLEPVTLTPKTQEYMNMTKEETIRSSLHSQRYVYELLKESIPIKFYTKENNKIVEIENLIIVFPKPEDMLNGWVNNCFGPLSLLYESLFDLNKLGLININATLSFDNITSFLQIRSINGATDFAEKLGMLKDVTEEAKDKKIKYINQRLSKLKPFPRFFIAPNLD
jgi:hypothetical protein